jgi:hypothetical protein
MPDNPLPKSDFTLDASGVAGFFGGDEAVYAMATVNIYQGRRWLGWYNSPGSYTVAKKYGQIAHSGIWDGLFPGIAIDPATLFELSGSRGPEYLAAQSGTIIQDTGHIGHLFMKECEVSVSEAEVQKVKGRITSAVTVTIAKLGGEPEYKMNPVLPQPATIHLAIIPIFSSLVTCALCGVYEDWYCFSMILLGIITSGLSCLVIGSAKLYFTHPKPAPGSPKGDGIMTGGKEMVILLGVEGAVNSVTRGEFSLVFADSPDHGNVGLCSLLLVLQFVAQLLLIPQGSLFGQIMFVTSLAVSWAYNSYLSSSDREKIQRRILREKILPDMQLTKYRLGTRTTMVVFVLLVLRCSNPEKLLNNLLPNDTNTWNIWKRVVLEKVKGNKPLSFDEGDYEGVDAHERQLLENLYKDAEAAYNGFLDYVPGKSEDMEKIV